MKSVRYRMVAGLCSVLALLSLAGCSQESLWPEVSQQNAVGDTPHLEPYATHYGKPYNNMQVAIIAPSDKQLDSDEQTTTDEQSAFIESAVDEQGMKGIVMQAAGDAGGQQRMVQDAIARGVSVIILAPDSAEGWEDTFQKARSAGIPVILVEQHADANTNADSTSNMLQRVDSKLYAATISWQEGTSATTAEEGKTHLAQTIADVINDEPHARTIILDTAWLNDEPSK